ncbi:phosphatase PAP2 family protein [Flavobacterium sp.]|uniref:phosphatase PAP2 family protein n=1 Tax=Flavobacterium sp. TaxID=239 RepID=UPI0025C42EA3|nr:phosphatase PAP2 family protein [Flavobacterium sp.]
MRGLGLLLSLLLLGQEISAQEKNQDSIQVNKSKKTFNYKSLLVPTVLIGYGVVSLENHTLQNLNNSTNEELREHIDKRFTLDDVTQYMPFLSVYALNNLGVKGKHQFTDRTLILGTAYLIMGATVNILKKTTYEMRPDGSSSNSFPSGHTATAFMGAEFLYQEYKNTSIWYGITGYAIATGTGFFRMYNDRHWLNDIATGAGIGILSTKIAYWLHPHIKTLLFKNEKKINGMALPYFNGKEYGVSVALRF